MAFYKYRSVNKEGKYVKGSLEAADESAAVYLIKQKGLLPLEVTIDRDIIHSLRRINNSKVPIKEIALFARQFSTILSAGATVISAMDMLKKQSSNKHLRKALCAAFEDLQKGRGLAQSLQARNNIFPKLFVSMIESGELGGTLDTAMLRMAEHYEKESQLNQKISAAMTYPTVIFTMSVLMIIFMVYFMLPTFMTLIDSNEGEIPALTAAVISITEFVRMKWYFIFLGFIVLAAFLKFAVTRGKGRIIYHHLLLKLPVLGRVIKKIIASRFARTLGMLQASGIPLLFSLESVKSIVGNAAAEEAIEYSITAIKNGHGLAVPLGASGVLDGILVKMVQIGEDTGSLDDMLLKTADFFDSEVESGLNQLMQLVEPSMLIIMGAIVGIIVIAMLLPMYGMLTNFGI